MELIPLIIVGIAVAFFVWKKTKKKKDRGPETFNGPEGS